MSETLKVVAIIPARGGSKRLPGKNIRLLGGKPMIAYALEAAQNAQMVNRVIVSTDDADIAEVAKKYGAEVPFLRPENLSGDEAKTVDVLKHTLTFLQETEQYIPDVVVLLQATSPLMLSEDIDATIEKFLHTGVRSCVTVCKIKERPEYMYSHDEGVAKPLLPSSDKLSSSQKLSPLFRLNGAVYALKKETLFDSIIIDDTSLALHIMPEERSVDIDELRDFELAELLLKTQVEMKRVNT